MSDNEIKQHYGNCIKDCEYKFSDTFVESIVECVNVGKQGSVPVRVPIVRVFIERGIGVDLVVDVREGEPVVVDGLICRKEQD